MKPMLSCLFIFMISILSASVTSATPTQEKRIALVVGNWDYSDSPLVNPQYDAENMAASLDRLGFEVLHRTNLDQKAFNKVIQEFGEKIRSGGSGVFFYAGHGMQINGINYLVPIGAKFKGEASVDKVAVNADSVLAQMSKANNRVNLVILDACRNNPFEEKTSGSDSGSRGSGGLAQMNAPSGTLISYSTSPGLTASDGAGRNSPFTKNLLTSMKQPGLAVEQVFKKVRVEVEKETYLEQTPWEVSSLKGDFYFNLTATTEEKSASGTADASLLSKDLAAWTTVQSSQDPAAYAAYLRQYPQGQFAELALWKQKTVSPAGAGKATPHNEKLLDLQLDAQKELLLLSAKQKGEGDVVEKFRTLVKESPEESLHAVGLAYAYLKTGNLDKAQQQFEMLTKKSDKTLSLQGKEGLAEILFLSGKVDEALRLAEQVLAAAPNRSMALLVKGKALFKKNKTSEAKNALELAAKETSISDFSWQKSEAHVALGNFQTQKKEFVLAQQAFKKAVITNPFSSEALSNQGVAFKNLGDPQTALNVFKQLKSVHPNDHLAAAFMRQAQAAIAQKKDIEHQEYINGMVKELVARFKEQKASGKSRDDWTSPVGAISLLSLKSETQGSLTGRIGVEEVLKDELTRVLTESGVSVVEREILDKVLEELKLGSSELADPKTQTKLGKITAAHILSTGSYYDSPKGSVATLRLVETETTDIFLAMTEKLQSDLDPTALATLWAAKMAKKIKEKFPLQGRLVKIKENEVILNLGKRHAVTQGMIFNVLSEGEAIDLGDGEIEYDTEVIGRIEVTQLKDKIAYAKIVSQKGDWTKDQKIIVAN